MGEMSIIQKTLLAVVAMVLVVACDRSDQQQVAKPAATSPVVATSQPAVQSGPKVIFLGDSLTAGLGVAADEAYPAVVARTLRETGTPIRLVNAGVSGDTTAGGLARLDWLLKQKPDVLIVALGSNDGLRGVKVDAIETNLAAILSRAKTSGTRVLLLGMRMPPNYGPEYTDQFAAIYPRLAEREGVPFVPFLLDGVGGDVNLNQADGIHPTALGHQKLAATILPKLREVIASLSGPLSP